MSDSLRDMFVGIRFKDKASNDIEKVNKLLDTAEQSAERLGKQLGKQLGLAEKNINRFGNAGTTSTDEFEKSLEDVSDKIVNLQKYLEKYGRAGLNSGNDVEKGSEQANNALNKTKNAANQAADATNEVGDAASGVANDFSNAQTIGVNAWTAIATAITGATIGITNLVAEHDEAMSRIAAKTGLAGKELVGIQDVVNNVFTAGVGSNLATVSDDVVRIKQSMQGLNNQELESFSKQAITISGLWGESSDKITWAVKNMTSNFKGLSEQQALDLITVGFQKTGDYAGDLLDTFKEYSPYFSKMGLSAQEFTGILVSGAQSGAWNLDLVADAVKEFGILSMDGSKTTIAGFKAIGLDADMMANKITQGGESANQAFYATIAGLAAMKDEVKRNEAGLALFGTKWEDVREDVILAMGGAKTAVQDFEGAAEKATTSASDNVKTKLTSAWRGFQSEMVGIFNSSQGQEAVDTIITGFTSALGVAKDFSGFIVNNWGLVSNTVLGLGTAVGYVAVVMGGMKVIGIVNTLMGMYQASTFASTVATHGFNAALRANPIGLVVTAIGLLITAGVLLYQNWDIVKEKATEVWGTVTNDWNTMKENIMGSVPQIKDKLSNTWNTIKTDAVNNWNELKQGIVNHISEGKDRVVGIVTEMPFVIAEKLGFLVGATRSIITQFPTVFAENFGLAKQWAVDKISALPGQINNFVTTTKNSAIAQVKELANGFTTWFTTAKNNAIATVTGLPTHIAGIVQQISGAVSQKIPSVYSKFKELGASIPSAISEGFTATFAGLSKGVRWAFDKMVSGITNLKSFGANMASSFNVGIKEGGNVKLDGSHATGLERVPYDGYRAELHKGEAVLTAGQSNALRSAGILSSNSDGTPSLNIETKAPTWTGMHISSNHANRTSDNEESLISTGDNRSENRNVYNNTSSTDKSNSISITIPITIQGNADNDTVAKLQSTMETTVRDVIARMLVGEIEATEG